MSPNLLSNIKQEKILLQKFTLVTEPKTNLLEINNLKGTSTYIQDIENNFSEVHHKHHKHAIGKQHMQNIFFYSS